MNDMSRANEGRAPALTQITADEAKRKTNAIMHVTLSASVSVRVGGGGVFAAHMLHSTLLLASCTQ